MANESDAVRSDTSNASVLLKDDTERSDVPNVSTPWEDKQDPESVTSALNDVSLDDTRQAGGTNGDKVKSKEEILVERKEREDSLSEEERERLREESRQLKVEGNEQFGHGFWSEAAQLYKKALDTCPLQYGCDRAIYYSNKAAANIKLNNWEAAIDDCTEALELGAPNEKPLERRAYAFSQLTEKYEKAVEDYEALLKMYPDRAVYREKIAMLNRQIEERNEKFKQDALSKLKELGNLCLKPFGLSTDNFEMVQQPGGGYSISMKK